MKKTIFTCFLWAVLLVQTEAQSNYIGGGGAYPWGIMTGMFHTNEKGWGISLLLNSQWQKAENQPSDYHGGSFLSSDQIHDNTTWFAVNVLKAFTTNDKNTRWGLEAGPVIVVKSTATNFWYQSGWNLFGPNYT